MPKNIRHKLGIPHLSPQQMALEIAERVRCARLWCQRYWAVLCNHGIHYRARFELYKFFVRPILTYGCELWRLDDHICRKLLRFECGVLVEIYKSKFPRRHPQRLRPNLRDVYSRFEGCDIIDYVNNERLHWPCLLRSEVMALRRSEMELDNTVCWWDRNRSRCASNANSRPCPAVSGISESRIEVNQSPIDGFCRTKSMDDAPS